MRVFLVGVLLVFVKSNLQLLDTGVFFYTTNAVGYLLICLGLRQLADHLPDVRRLLPAASLMVLHSIGFAVLNGADHSIQVIALTSGVATALALTLAALAVSGMGMIFYILHEVLIDIRDDETEAFAIGRLEKVPGLLLVLLVVATVLYFIAPPAANAMILAMLAGEVLLLVRLSSRNRVGV